MHRLLVAIATSVVVLSILNGCSTPRHPKYLTDDVRSSFKTVSISKDVRFPDRMVVPPSHASVSGSGPLGAAIALAAGGAMIHAEEERLKRLNDQLASQVDIHAFLSERICAEFGDMLRTNSIFKVADGEIAADAEFVFVVESYGVEERQSMSGMWNEVFLKTSVMLIGHPPYVLTRTNKKDFRLEPEDMTNNPVLWQRTVNAKGTARRAKIALPFQAQEYDQFFDASVTNDYFEAVTNLTASLSGALNENPKGKK